MIGDLILEDQVFSNVEFEKRPIMNYEAVVNEDGSISPKTFPNGRIAYWWDLFRVKCPLPPAIPENGLLVTTAYVNVRDQDQVIERWDFFGTRVTVDNDEVVERALYSEVVLSFERALYSTSPIGEP